jgi:hypothetical protein
MPTKKSDNWIKDATANKGGLHRSTGTPEGEKIPAAKIAKAKKGAYGPKAKKQAALATTLKKVRP